MNRPILSALTGMAAGIAFALPVAAQTVALGTTKGGATAQISTAIANVVSSAGELQVRPQPMANTSQYIPLVDSGGIEFGIANFPQTFYAVKGTGMSSTPAPNLRVVASLFPFQAGIVIPADLDANSFEDLKGKTVPRFQDGSLGEFIIRAALNAGGLTYDDVGEVPIANFPRMWDAMKQKQTDIAIAAVGSKPTYDLQAALGGIRFLAFDPSDAEEIAEILPGAFLRDVAADTELPGLDQPTRVFAYQYLLFAHKDVSADAVKSVAKALYEGEEALKASGALWREFDPAKMAPEMELEYHPAALDFYKEVGVR